MLDAYPFSEGARRVLNAWLALHENDEPLNWNAKLLLWCLFDDGSRGAEILEIQGVTDRLICELTERDPDGTLTAGVSEEWFSLMLGDAHRMAGQAKGQTEIGTEHLLAALLNQHPHFLPLLNLNCSSGDDLLTSAASDSHSDVVGLEEAISLRNVSRPANEQADLFRTLDAAANRCREGLRVLEDHVRFRLSDAFLSEQLKQLRHDLQRHLKSLHDEHWMTCRNASQDVGPAVTRQLEAPMFRGTIEDVIQANGKRVGEALRTLEEFGKLVDVVTACAIEQLRYRFYTIEQALHALQRNRQRLAECRLYLLVTDRLCQQGLGPVVRESIQSGVDIVQLREKEMPDRRLVELARYVRDWTAEAGVLFIINDRPDIAALVRADGVHLGQDDLTVAEARRIVGGKSLIGVSTHNLDQVRQGILDGADYLGVGPVFPSSTKAFDEFPGLDFVREVAQETAIPWYPLGGINLENIQQVLEAGATRAAVSGAISSAPSPRLASEALSKLLQSR